MSKPDGSRHGPLRIGVLSPISWRTPPVHYGPWELFASLLTEGLVAAGHDVTLFATRDSITAARLVGTAPGGWSDTPGLDTKVEECLHIAAAFEQADQFDILHNSFDFLPLTYSRLTGTPVVTTIHGFSSELIVPVYEKYNDASTYVSISDSDRHPRLTYGATIHHGIDVDAFPLGVVAEPYLLFFGRIHPHKGTAEAIHIARTAGIPLVIAGIIQDERYFADQVEPFVDDITVRFVGAVGGAERIALLGGAICLLHPIDFDEPFGFSVVEAMASGTPVIAYRRGSMPELIDDETGRVVANADEALSVLDDVRRLDRAEVRANARRRFSSNTMVSRYVELYHQVLEGQRRT